MLVRAVFGSLAALLLCATAMAGYKITGFDITGAGSTSPTFVFGKWADEYRQQYGININYQHVGSESGVKQLRSRTVDFATTDVPLSSTLLERVGLVQFPIVMGPIVPVVHIRGVGPGELRLTGPVLADLFLGNIRFWDHPAIKELNPDLTLPPQPVFIVKRSDESGATYNLTRYLSEVSEEWNKQVGTGALIEFPPNAQILGAKGNNGVANFVKRTPGSIGYIHYAHAFEFDLKYVQLKNRDGNFVSPSLETFQGALEGAEWSEASHYSLSLVNRPGANTWPINTVSYIVMHKGQRDVLEGRIALRFFDWSFDHGDNMGRELGYVPMPKEVVEMIRGTWTEIVDANNQPLYPVQ